MPVRNIPVIAVTGSAGKTTTKEMIASILRRRWNVFKSAGNANLPANTRKHAKRLNARHRAAVLEFGMLRKGHIRQHCSLLQPSFGVITNVGTAHIGNVGNRVQGIASAKSELIRHMKTTGTLVLNADDANSRLLSVKGFQGKIVKVGIHGKADYRASGIRTLNRVIAFRVQLDGKEEMFTIPCLGVHNVYNALNAIAIAHRLGFSGDEIRRGLANYPIPYRRLVRTELPRRITLIDDTFSSNPDATKAALDTLATVSRKYKIAVIGYMKDLGQYARKGHEDVGKYAAKKGLTRLYTVGKLANYVAAGAKQAGFPANRIRRFESRPPLHKALAETIKPNTAILVKGTHLLKLERTVSFLKRSLAVKRP
jgi:UDP-N-acetylmuramoyl-tripeptide--D-alanyl-D-alanine ligase